MGRKVGSQSSKAVTRQDPRMGIVSKVGKCGIYFRGLSVSVRSYQSLDLRPQLLSEDDNVFSLRMLKAGSHL